MSNWCDGGPHGLSVCHREWSGQLDGALDVGTRGGRGGGGGYLYQRFGVVGGWGATS